MEPTHHHAMEAAMPATLSPETPAQEVARIRAKFPRWSAAKVLSAIGHPGYSAKYAGQVLDAIQRTGYSAHQVIYNGWGM